jgi:hypothetical protein
MASFMLVVLSKQKLGDEPFLIFFHVEAPQVTGSSKAVQPKFPLIMLTAFILASVHLAHSQQPKKVLRIGYLTTRSGPEAGKKSIPAGFAVTRLHRRTNDSDRMAVRSRKVRPVARTC